MTASASVGPLAGDSDRPRARLAVGPLAGATAFGIGFWVLHNLQRPAVAKWIGPEGRSEASLAAVRWPGEAVASVGDVTGWLFYTAHMVEIELTVDKPGTLADTAGVLTLESTPIWSWYLPAIPLLCLFVAGSVVGSAAASDTQLDNAMAGASIVGGYLPLAILGVLVTRWAWTVHPTGGTHTVVTVQPPLQQSVLIAGFLYPVVVGGIGGVIGGWVRGKLHPRTPEHEHRASEDAND